MRTSDLCKIADFDAQLFKKHRHQENLPFTLPEANGRGWASFDGHHAAALIAARDLTDQGLGWSSAAALMREPKTHLGAGLKRPKPWQVDGIYVVRASFRETNGDLPFLGKPDRLYAGTLQEVMKMIEMQVAVSREKRCRPEVCVGVVMTNLSEAYRVAIVKADSLGIDLGDDSSQWEIDQ